MSNNNYTGPYAEGEPYAKLIFKQFSIKNCEIREPHQPKAVWHINVKDFHENLKAIDPNRYFVTSGEAVIKAKTLCNDLSKALSAAKKLHSILKHFKGDASYLETQWEASRLLVKKKYTRPTSRINIKKIHDDVDKKIEEAGKKENFVCPLCGKECKSIIGLKLHANRCKKNVGRPKKYMEEADPSLCCPNCGKACRSKSGLTMHIRRCKGGYNGSEE